MNQYLVPFIVTNVVSALLIVLAFLRPKSTRIIWSLIFLAAGIFNLLTVYKNPQAYVIGFGPTAMLAFYRSFIYGAFSRNAALFVSLIAVGQIVVAGLLVLKKPWYRLGILGGIIFLVAISPLGLGSAFPSTLLMATSLCVLDRKLGDAGNVIDPDLL